MYLEKATVGTYYFIEENELYLYAIHKMNHY